MPDPVRREQLLAKAVQDGKIPPSRVDHYRGLYESDPTGTEKLLAALLPGLPPGELEAMHAQLYGDGVGAGAPPNSPYAFDPQAGTGRVFEARD